MTASKTYNRDTSSGGDLYWPANIADTFDYLEIEIMKFEPRSKRTRVSQVSSVTAPTSGPVAEVEGFLNNLLTSIGIGSGSGSSTFFTTSSSLSSAGKILLPIPDNLSYTDNPQWSDQAGSAITRFGSAALSNALASGDIASDEVIADIQRTAEAGKIGVIKNLVQRLGVDPNALSQNTNGKIMNPYMEQVFQGVGLRQFDFNWKLVPRNKKEQQSINRIVKTLRTNILPNLSDNFTADTANAGNDSGARPAVDRWLTVPKVFQLRWKHSGSEIDSLPKLKPCVCKNISVQYTPDGVWATHMMDGQPNPVSYNLTLSFGEMEIITGKDAESGF